MKKLKTEELIEEYFNVEYAIDEMMNIRNLQEHEDDESYHLEIDELREKRKLLEKELKTRNLEYLIPQSQADLHF